MTPPEFFVPAATTAEQAEKVYANFARWCGRPVPPMGRRIYSIKYLHDGEEWTATVGEQLQGVRRRTGTRHGKRAGLESRLSDPAIVLAIFPGTPYMVVTNRRPVGNAGSAWENPFMAGRPRSVTYFQAKGGKPEDGDGEAGEG